MRVRLVLLVALFFGGCTRDRSLTSEKVVAFTRALSAWYDQTAAAGLAGTIDANEMTNRQVDELSMLKNQIGLGPGDIDRIIIEWRSLLRQMAHAPDLDWPRWRALQQMAKAILRETESPTLTDLPPLEYHQTKRVDHRLILRRH